MQQTLFLDELDDESRQYLVTVKNQQGEGAPGVFVPTTNWLPLIGLIVGIVLIGIVLIFTLAPLDNPFGMALLQTALLLPGGWMIVAALRVWIGAGVGTNLGHFVYADANRVWHAQGSKVTITELAGLEVAVATDNYNDGNYQNTTVEMGLRGGGHAAVTLNNLGGAHDLVNFLNALVVTRASGGGQSTAVQLAAAAKGMALGGYYAPQYARGGEDPALANPPTPERISRPLAGWVACGVIVLIAVGTIFLMNALNVSMRDHAIFELLKQVEARRDSNNVDYLRTYLLDPRCTRNVEAVKEMLSRHYDAPIQELRAKAGEQPLPAEFIKQVENVRKAAFPAVSLRVTEMAPEKGLEKGDDFTPGSRAARAVRVREKLAECLCGAVGGDKLLSFVEVPEDVKPQIEFVYGYVTIPAKAPWPARQDFVGEFRFRLKPEDKETVVECPPPDQPAAAGNPLDAMARECARHAGRAMTGRYGDAEPFVDPTYRPGGLNPGFNP